MYWRARQWTRSSSNRACYSMRITKKQNKAEKKDRKLEQGAYLHTKFREIYTGKKREFKSVFQTPSSNFNVHRPFTSASPGLMSVGLLLGAGSPASSCALRGTGELTAHLWRWPCPARRGRSVGAHPSAPALHYASFSTLSFSLNPRKSFHDGLLTSREKYDQS